PQAGAGPGQIAGLHECAPKTVSQNLQLALGREFQTLATLRHPHIISVLDYGFVQTDTEPQTFYTMAYLPEAATLLEAWHVRFGTGHLGHPLIDIPE
ncbi:MAG: hypothetical protein GY809_13590, partial [Planctomycetes bacterium]|nr:hypothetical protein [Planctomycetota bacterium]